MAVARGGLSECHKEEEKKRKRRTKDGGFIYGIFLGRKRLEQRRRTEYNTSILQQGSVCLLLLKSWQSNEPMDGRRI